MDPPVCDIVVRSYWRDFDWLEWCLRSVERFCTGFRHIVLIVPASSEPWLARQPALPRPSRLVVCPDYSDDYLGQQVSKLYADAVTDAELICHVDADCVFVRPTSPAELAPDGRPRIYTRPVGELCRHWPWTAPTAEFLGWQPTHDFMQCPPFVFPSWLYGEVRDWSRRRHGVELTDWVLSRPPRGFSEFNVLGAFAYRNHPDAFVWTRAVDLGSEESTCRWYWSWARVDAETDRDLAAIVGTADG